MWGRRRGRRTGRLLTECEARLEALSPQDQRHSCCYTQWMLPSPVHIRLLSSISHCPSLLLETYSPLGFLARWLHRFPLFMSQLFLILLSAIVPHSRPLECWHSSAFCLGSLSLFYLLYLGHFIASKVPMSS